VRRTSTAAALALLVALAACSGPAGDRDAQGSATGGRPVTGAGGPTRPSAVWSSGPQSRARRGGGEAVLTEVRAARQPGYDRLVFEFEGGLPGYRARYVDRVTTAGGERLDLEGQAFLLLALDGASVGDAAVAGYLAHDLPDPDRVIVDVAA
jgi:hypothetical protein